MADAFKANPNKLLLAIVLAVFSPLGAFFLYMFLAGNGHWGWLVGFTFCLVALPSTTIKYLSAARFEPTAEGVKGLGSKGKVIPWSEVEAVKFPLKRILITGPDTKIMSNLGYMLNHQEAVDFVRSRCEAHGIEVK